MLKKWRNNKKSLKWSGILLAFVMIFGVSIGFWGDKLVKAFEGDYWTVEYDGLSITVTSVVQNGLSLAPQDDGSGGYYFEVGNSMDIVTVGLMVDGMQQGESYYYYANDDYFSGRRELTNENNGQVIFEELKPHIYFQDEDSCHGSCWVDPTSGLYYVGASVNRENGYGVQKDIAVRPTSVGSRSIDIIAVKQDGVDLALVNNEYQITDYHAPVAVTYKLRNLEIGKLYSVDLGYVDYYDFRAETTEVTTTRELSLDFVGRHISTNIYLYGSGDSESVDLYFNVADESFAPLGDIIVTSISQGGQVLTPELSTGWRREYTFTANDAQGLMVELRTTRATADINYYVTYSMYGQGGGYISSDEPIVITGEELEHHGIVLPVEAAFGLSEHSPFTLSFSVRAGEANSPSSSSRKFIYQDYAEYQSTSDAFYVVFNEDENIPRYDAAMFYSDGTIVDSDTISPIRHDGAHPLSLQVRGEHYNDEQSYEVMAKVKVNQETYYSHQFTATGAELNGGVTFALNGLELRLPVFDPNESSSASEIMYNFSLEIDGLKQGGDMYYAYDGWISSLMTYDGGEVAAIGAGGGMGGTRFVDGEGMTVRKSSLDGSKGAVLHYLGSRFDESLNYNYTLYYNGSTDEEWWSAEAGAIVDEGVLTGAELNNGDYSVEVAIPSNESTGVMYTLVITRNGELVKAIHTNMVFTEEPKIESFKFSANNDSFMQTGWSSYRVAAGTDIAATLTGAGFENETNYKLWVNYEGYRYGEENEYGESNPERVDLSALNASIPVTGAQLNGGYVYALDYNEEAFDGVNFIEVGFVVSDVDVTQPNWYGEAGNGSYTGHNVHIDYVNEDEVFRDNGYQVNDDGTITDVSQPTGIEVRNLTDGNAETVVIGNSLNVTSGKACVVIGQKNGEYERINAVSGAATETTKTYAYDLTGYLDVMVVLKGDVDMRGSLSARDSAKINYHLLSGTNPNHRDLTTLEMLIADVDGNDRITARDAAMINYALLSNTNPNHRDLSW